MKRAEGEYLGKLQRLGCIACRELCKQEGSEYEPPDPSLQMTVIHHLRNGQGMAWRAPNWLTVPLCVAHHTGNWGVHSNGNKTLFPHLFEMELLALTIELYVRTYG